jgi:hypothetical protein
VSSWPGQVQDGQLSPLDGIVRFVRCRKGVRSGLARLNRNLYSSLLRCDGIIAFHDTVNYREHYDVTCIWMKFVNKAR